MKILVGEVSSYKAIAITKFLHINYDDITLYTFDNRKFTRYVRTRYSHSANHYVLNQKSVDSYLHALSDLVKDLDIDIFIPVHSKYIGEILKQKNKFHSSLSYLGDYSTYQKLHVKDTLQKIAGSLNIDVPENYADINEAQLPFVAKPTEGSSSEGVEYFIDEKPGNEFEQKSRSYIYQEYIEGVGCGYSVYAENGEILVGYGHKRLAEYPVKGGSSVYRTGFFVDEMREAAGKILHETGWTGFAMFEFKYTENGRLVLIEVNPRIWGSFNQGLQNGYNYFEPILGESDTFRVNPTEVNTYLSPQIYFVLIRYIFRLKFLPIQSFFSSGKKRKPDISMFGDFCGWISVICRSFFS